MGNKLPVQKTMCIFAVSLITSEMKDKDQNKDHFWKDKVLAPVLVTAIGGTLLYAGKKFINWASKALEKLADKHIQSDSKQDSQTETTKWVIEEGNVSETKSETVTDMTQEGSETLVGELICKGETALVFGASDTGKSKIVSQWAAALAGGTDELSLPNHPIADHPQHVFYFDTEGQDIILDRLKQAFPLGMSIYMHYLTPEEDTPTLEEICDEIKKQICRFRGDCTVIIDNLSTFTDITKPRSVVDFLKNQLKRLKNIKRKQGYRLTILLVSHTTKEASDEHKSLGEADVAGASKLFELCDCVWAVELSRVQCPAKDGMKDHLRILKPLKWKHGNKNFVFLLQPEGEDMSFHFKYKCTSNEEDALKGKLEQPCVNTNVKDEDALQPTMSAKTCKKQKRSNAPISEKIKEKIRQLFKRKKPVTKIAELCNVSRPTVYKYTKDLLEERQRA